MEPTRRWWTTVAAGGVLLVVGVLAQRPVLLAGVGVLAAWLVATTAWTTRWMVDTANRLDVDVTLSQPVTRSEETVTATLAVERPESAARGSVTVDLAVPPGLTSTDSETAVTLAAGDATARTATAVDTPVVGRFTLPEPQVTFRDPFGLYTQRFAAGPTPSLTVAARTPSSLHVGQGGTTVLGAFGEHEGDRAGPGVVTRELREYLPGDSADAIDWKATARLGDVFVRETEAETDRRTVLVVDHRDRMAYGRDGETMLAYAREVAQGIAGYAADAGDPLGLWTVGANGSTTEIPPDGGQTTYTRIRNAILDLEPDRDASYGGARSPVTARRVADRLADEETHFARTLQPYVADAGQYVTQVRADPLVETVRRIRTELAADTQVAIVTTDRDPVRLKETVRLATLGGGHALVFLTPRALFDPGGLSDLDEAYEAYLTFEELRREIDGYPRTAAFEVAPGDRLAAVLSARRQEGRA